MSNTVVIDASASVELLLGTETGQKLSKKLSDTSEWVPEHYFVEVAGVIRRAELNGRITSERAALALSRLLSAPAQRVQVQPLISEAWKLRHNVTLADALYVVLAYHLGAPLVTADLKLAATSALDVEFITP